MGENNLSIDSTDYPVGSGKGPPSAQPVYSWRQCEDPPAIRLFLGTLSRRKWSVLVSILVAFAVMTAVTVLTPRTYRGQASVQVIPAAPNVTTFAEVMSNSSPGDELTRTQAAILKNRGLAARVIKKLHMAQNPAFNPYLSQENRGTVHRIKELLAGGMRRLFYGKLPAAMVALGQREALMGEFERNLDVECTPGTNIITVAFSSPDRLLAKQASNETVNELMKWAIDRNVDAARLAKAQLAKQIEVAHARLEKSQAHLDKYARQWGIVSPKSGSNLVLQQLDIINEALGKVRANLIAESAYYVKAQKSNLASVPAVMQSNLIQQLQKEYAQLMSKYERERAVFKENYLPSQRLKAQIAYTLKRIASEEKRIVESMREGYRASARIAQALEARAKKNQALALAFTDKIEAYKTLRTQVDTNRRIYTSLLKRSGEIEANVGTELGNVKVLSLSSLPVVPYKPNLFLNFAIALVLGVAGGIGMAFILENSDVTLRSPGEVSLFHATRVLGVLPLVGRAQVKGLAAKVLSEPDAIFSEAMRFTKTVIELSNSTGNRARSMLITTTNENAGKSTVAVNLALAYATSTQDRVLLVDADLAFGHLHDVFAQNGGKAGAGLSDYLSGLCTLDEILCRTELPNLSFIASGRESGCPGQLLHSEKAKNLMPELLSRFDRIVVDGQPLGSDTLAVAKMVDGVIFIAAIGRTDRKSLQIFQESMSNVGANVLGVIVNKLRGSRYSFDYYSRSYRFSGRKSSGERELIAQMKCR